MHQKKRVGLNDFFMCAHTHLKNPLFFKSCEIFFLTWDQQSSASDWLTVKTPSPRKNSEKMRKQSHHWWHVRNSKEKKISGNWANVQSLLQLYALKVGHAFCMYESRMISQLPARHWWVNRACQCSAFWTVCSCLVNANNRNKWRETDSQWAFIKTRVCVFFLNALHWTFV